MGSIKNRIITLSGQPATGKSTVKNILIQKYEDLGFEVKEFATGEKFREYFNDMIELLIAVKNKNSEKTSELSQREGIKRIMYDSNGNLKPSSMQMVKDTLHLMEERNFDFDSFDIERANNSQSLAKIRETIDSAIDGYIKEDLRKNINSVSNPRTIWIIDSMLAWNNIPKDESFSIRLISDERIAGERAYKRFLGKFDELIKNISGRQELNAEDIKMQLQKIDSVKDLTDEEKLQTKFDLIEDIINLCLDNTVKNISLDEMSKVKEESYENLDTAIDKIYTRKQGERDRYKKRYNIDLEDEGNYKLLVDTSYMTPEEISTLILESEQKAYSIEGYKNGENVGWDR